MAGPAQPLPQGSRGLDEGGCTLAPSCRATAHGHSWLMRARDGGKSRKRSSCSGPSGDWGGRGRKRMSPRQCLGTFGETGGGIRFLLFNLL